MVTQKHPQHSTPHTMTMCPKTSDINPSRSATVSQQVYETNATTSPPPTYANIEFNTPAAACQPTSNPKFSLALAQEVSMARHVWGSEGFNRQKVRRLCVSANPAAP